jgi:hypothetical protein
MPHRGFTPSIHAGAAGTHLFWFGCDGASPMAEEDLVAGTGPAAREARRKLKRRAKKSAERAEDAEDAASKVEQPNERGASPALCRRVFYSSHRVSAHCPLPRQYRTKP